MKPYWQIKKRKIFKPGEVAMVNINGFFYGGRFADYILGSKFQKALIDFPTKYGLLYISCIKAKNGHHWNPIDKSVF